MTDTTRAAWDGRPENPERDGWHWLQHEKSGQPDPWRWWASTLNEPMCWSQGVSERSPQQMRDGWRYLGPALLPAQVAAAVEAEREACAALVLTGVVSAGGCITDHRREVVAAAIRARGPGSALADALRQAEARGMQEAAKVARAETQGRVETGGDHERGAIKTALRIEAAILAAADAKEKRDA